MRTNIVSVWILCACAIGASVYASEVRHSHSIVCGKSDAVCYYEASRTFSMEQQPKKAFAMINQAVVLQPNDVTYLKQRAIIANWLGDLNIMGDSYARIIRLDPADRSASLGMARYYSQANQLNKAVESYQHYLSLSSKNRKAWIEYANVQNWRGDYSASLDALTHYEKLFGSTYEYLNVKSRVLVWAGKPIQALSIVNPMLVKQPLNYDLNVTRALALYVNKQPQEALKALKIVQKIQPFSEETKKVTSRIRASFSLGTNVAPGNLQHVKKINILHVFLFGQYFLSPVTVLSHNAEHSDVMTQKASEYEKVGNRSRIFANGFWTGLRHRFNYRFMLEDSVWNNTDVVNHDGLYSYDLDAKLRTPVSSHSGTTPSPENASKPAAVTISKVTEKAEDKTTASVSSVSNPVVATTNTSKVAPQPTPKAIPQPASKTTPKARPRAAKSSRYNAYSRKRASSQRRCGRNDAVCYYEASRTYSMRNQPKKALTMINRAVELRPNNITYLKQRAVIANWVGDLDAMHDSYTRILKFYPTDHEGLLGMARYYTQTHQLDKAAKKYQHYLSVYPKSQKAWIEYANVQSWRGHYRASFVALNQYKKLFGSTYEYLNVKSRILAWAGRPTQALKIVNPMLKKRSANYDLNVTRAISLSTDKQPRKALKALGVVQKIKPTSEETKDVTAFVKTPLYSNINVGADYSEDTEKIDVLHVFLFGQEFFSPVTSLLYGVERWDLSARRDSDYATIDNKRRMSANNFWLGVRHRFNRRFMAEASGGYTRTENNHDFFSYDLIANARSSDTSSWRLEHKYSLYPVSPRALSLGIKRAKTELQFEWEPYLQRYLTAVASYSTFSDHNSMWSIYIKPSMGVLRTQLLNVDLGVSASQFGFSKDLNNGYYDPKNAEYYAVTADMYFKQSQNVGYSVSLAAGAQKDNTYKYYRFGCDAAVKAFIGIYKKLMLVVGVDASNRESEVNDPEDSKHYRVVKASAMLTRRF